MVIADISDWKYSKSVIVQLKFIRKDTSEAEILLKWLELSFCWEGMYLIFFLIMLLEVQVMLPLTAVPVKSDNDMSFGEGRE